MAQTYQSVVLSEGYRIPYTPASATVAGQIAVPGSLVRYLTQDIAANALGSALITGLVRVVKIAEEITAGAIVYWDANGNPQGGTVGTGGATVSTDTGGNATMGIAIATAAETDETVDIYARPPAPVSA